MFLNKTDFYLLKQHIFVDWSNSLLNQVNSSLQTKNIIAKIGSRHEMRIETINYGKFLVPEYLIFTMVEIKILKELNRMIVKGI